jgi:hypothetical protein
VKLIRRKGAFMRLPLIGKLALSLGLLVVSAGAAAGQTTVAANYDALLHELTENSSLGAHGDVTRFWGPIAIVGEVGANHFDQATVITLAPGGRYAIIQPANSKIALSAQAVVGLWHCSACEVNELFLQPGVILDWGRSDAMAIRFQFDVRRIFFDFGGETAERIGVGVVWTLK